MAAAPGPRSGCWPQPAPPHRTGPGRSAPPRTGPGEPRYTRSPWLVAVELRRKKSTRGAQYRIGPAQLGVLPLQLPDPRRISGRRPRPLTRIHLRLLHPPAQRVAVDPQLLPDPPARRRDAPGVLGDVRNQANRPVPHLIRVLLWCWHDSTLSWVRSLHQSRGDSVLAGGGPGQEVPDVVGGRAGGEPGLHVALTAGSQGEVMVPQPGQEGDYGEDLVPGAAGDGAGAGAGLGPAAQALQDLPGQGGPDEPPVGGFADGVG